jgi:transcriptional regulator with XRE-family HTH domain
MIGKRLKIYRTMKQMTGSELGELMGISYTSVSLIESGKTKPAAETLAALERNTDINISWLLTGEGEMIKAKYLYTVGNIPVLGTIPATYPDGIAEHIKEYITVPDAPDNAHAVKVKGDRMAPIIREGDYALFLPGYAPGNVVVVVDEWTEPILRRYREKDGEPWLTCDNPEYAAERIGEGVRIIGHVIRGWRPLDIL